MKIAIIGYGAEGRTVERYFSGKGYAIEIRDVKNRRDYLEGLDKFDMIFRSPGVPFLKKELQMPAVRKKLTSSTEYFFEKCPCKIVGITGTKGKGTTASLLYKMLKIGYKRGKVFLGGNIGMPALEFLDELSHDDLVILELSSFQLQDLNCSPHIAIVLAITPDHLDHHRDFEEYIDAKKNIVRFQTVADFVVLDIDNEISRGFAKGTKAKVLRVSIKKPVEEGGFLKLGSLIIKKSGRGKAENAGGARGMIIGEKGYINLLGEHNLKNILVASVAADLLRAPVEIIARVVREFKGLPHRLEFVKEIAGARYYNDSASTNPETAIAALRAFSGPTILIAGGSSKNADYSPLGGEIAKRLNVKTVILMGETKSEIERAIEYAVAQEEKRIQERALRTSQPVRRRDVPLELIAAQSYQEAFMVARLMAQPGDTVLFSPASASFDMFSNYQERGDIFRDFMMTGIET